MRVAYSTVTPEAGDYTNSLGITPGIINLRCLPSVAPIANEGDVTFDDGTRQVVLKNCRVLACPTTNDRSGQTWNLQLQDARWRWQYGYISGVYNGRPGGVVVPDEDYTAQDLATLLLEEMKLAGGYDLGDLPAQQWPEAKWDYANPAQELQKLCDLFGMVIAYDPTLDRVKLCAKGEGIALQRDRAEKYDETITAPSQPATLIAVAEREEHEVDLTLEAVGEDTDGAVKPLASLSYVPANWEDFPQFMDLTAEQLKSAEPSVFLWYRIAATHNLEPLGNKQRHELLPLLNRLVDTVVETQANEDDTTRHRPSYINATNVEDPDSSAKANTNRYIYDGYQVDERRGIVKFARPVYAWSGTYMVGATMSLKCTVRGERYTKERAMAGTYGSRVVFCPGVVLAYRAGVPSNKAETDRQMDEVLTRVAKEYDPTQQVQASYIGLNGLLTDGAVFQVSISIGSDGATTHASRNSEHANVPPMKARRMLERQAGADREERKLPAMYSFYEMYNEAIGRND